MVLFLEQDQVGAEFEGGRVWGLGNSSGFLGGQRAKRVHGELHAPTSMRKYIFAYGNSTYLED